MTRWKEFRYRLEEWFCQFLVWGIPRLSRRTCVQIGRALGTLAFYLDRRGRNAALTNLECVWGERFNPAERKKIAIASYQNFVRTMLDLFWAQTLTRENYSQWIRLIDTDVVRRVQDHLTRKDRGVVFLCVHQGNWEWASLLGGLMGFSNTVVAENFKNPRLTAIFQHLRQHTGTTIIPQDNSLIRMLKIVKRGGLTGMLIDLNLRPSQAATVIEAFRPDGLKMCVPLLHAVLAARANALLVPVETQPAPDGTCTIRVHPPVEYPQDARFDQITQACWDAFEPILRERPQEWLWPYKHFRYKPKATSRAYPPYANESGKFEKLLKELAAV